MLIIAYSLGHLYLPTLRIAFPASRLTPWLVSRSWTSSLRRCRTSQDHVACTELFLLCQISCGHVTSTDPGVDRCRLSLDACVLFCFVGTRGVFGLYSKDEISSYLVQRYISELWAWYSALGHWGAIGVQANGGGWNSVGHCTFGTVACHQCISCRSFV
jgi:hypothetical protein